MQSSIERRRLLQAMNAEPAHAWMVLAKCAAGLAVIVLLAAIGASERLDYGAAGNVAAAVTLHARQSAQEHRKQVFDDRRARFERGAGRHSIAREAVELANPLPPPLALH